MGGAFQGSLLDVAEEASLGALGRSVRRTVLAHGAWTDVRRGWITGADVLFERLLGAVPWRAERRTMYDRAQRALPGRAGRAAVYGGVVPVPGRPGQRGMAR
jgi:hypothetical protein